GDDSDFFVYALTADTWRLKKQVFCRKRDDDEKCGVPSYQDLGLAGFADELRIWHAAQKNNPFVVDRKTRPDGPERVEGELTFNVLGKRSVLSYRTLEGPHSGATLTMGVQLRTDGQPAKVLADAQCDTGLVGRYLLVVRYWNEATEVIDV